MQEVRQRRRLLPEWLKRTTQSEGEEASLISGVVGFHRQRQKFVRAEKRCVKGKGYV